MMKEKGIFYGVGIGPGDPELITLKALRRIEQTEVICAPKTKNGGMLALSILGQIVDLEHKTIIPIDSDMERDLKKREEKYRTQAKDLAEYLDAGHDVVMINIGDISIYATVSYMADALGELGYRTAMIPGVPSFCAVAAALNESLTHINEPLHVIPASVRDIEAKLALEGTKILMKSGRQLKKTLDSIAEAGLLEDTSLVSNCGLPNQIVLKKIKKDTDIPDQAGYFTTLIVKDKKREDAEK